MAYLTRNTLEHREVYYNPLSSPRSNLPREKLLPGSLSLLPIHFDLYLHTLKVPKREIFDRSDFPDFYTIKSLRVGDFGIKIKKFFTNI